MSCVGCTYYSELKEPRAQRHAAGYNYTIHGYCYYGSDEKFKFGDAVLVPELPCPNCKRARRIVDE